MIKVLIADDHPIFRKGLIHIIEQEEDINIIADVGSGSEVMKLLPNIDVDVAVLDVVMPGLTGLEVAQKIKEQSLPINVIILTSHKEELVLNQALEYGAKGFVLKGNATKDIISSIRMVAEGKAYISPELSEFLIKQKPKNSETVNDLEQILTKAELRIVKNVLAGNTSKQIAEELFLSQNTIENHRYNISKKLGLKGVNSLLKFVLLNRKLIEELD